MKPLLLLLLLPACPRLDDPALARIPAQWRAAHPATVANGASAMVVTAAPLATRVGVDVLRRGGNAADAAIATAFALAAVYPTAGNLGGGGFIVARMGKASAALDFRETAPGKATPGMFLDAKGEVTEKSITGPLAAGVPGSVAGLWAMHEKYGSKPWRELLQPAIDLAEQGFATDAAFHEDIESDSDRLKRFPATAAMLLPGGQPVPRGAMWRNPDLAATLRRIAEKGRDGFYMGETAELIAREMARSGGIISKADLVGYRAIWRAPIEFTYRGHRVISMPPASSGGLTIALVANILDGIDMGTKGWHSADAIATVADAERLAFARRNRLLADPDFVKIPTAAFLSEDTAAALRAQILAGKLPAAAPVDPERDHHTTSFSIVDANGNAVAMTTTLNNGYGSAVTVTGGGFLLNDEMDDFTTKPGVVNAMGLRQWEANAIAPGKRMLSSMSPTIVLDSVDAPMLVTGASGGARIITGVAQVIFSVLDYHLSLGIAMSAPRFHAQDYPDSLLLDRGGYSDDLVRALGERGQHPTISTASYHSDDFGWVQSILRSGVGWDGVSEPRGSGLALGY